MTAAQPQPDIAPAGAVWMSCTIACTSASLMALTRARASLGSTPAASNWPVTSPRSSAPSTIARSVGALLAAACSTPISPALALCKEKNKVETTSARQINFLDSMERCSLRLSWLPGARVPRPSGAAMFPQRASAGEAWVRRIHKSLQK
jgi:hypothetical protein